MNKKTYSIVVTFNGENFVKKCFSSLINSTIDNHHILCIDNGSTDKTLELIRIEFPQVEILETYHNIGFGKANNIGIMKALEFDADYFFLINQDAWVEPDTIKILIEEVSNGSDFGVISPMHFSGNEKALDNNFSSYLIPKYCPDFISDIFTGFIKDQPYDIQFVNAAAWLLSRKCINTVGGFNPNFFMYGEDRNYIERIKYHGMRVGITPKTKIFHNREQNQNPIIIDKEMIKIFEITLLLKLSSPEKPSIINDYNILLVKILFSSIIRFKIAFFLNLIKKIIKTLLNVRKISECRNISKKRGLCFISKSHIINAKINNK